MLVEDNIIYLCNLHYNELMKEIDLVKDKVSNMNVDEMIERPKELEGGKIVH